MDARDELREAGDHAMQALTATLKAMRSALDTVIERLDRDGERDSPPQAAAIGAASRRNRGGQRRQGGVGPASQRAGTLSSIALAQDSRDRDGNVASPVAQPRVSFHRMHHLHLVQTIGNTPMVELRRLSPKPGVRLFAKLEGFNPTGSIKDRIVRHMIQHAEREGRIVPGDTIVEASTGNTGIALAMIGRALGYNVRVVMPENVYPEIPRALEVYKPDIEWVSPAAGIRGAMARAHEIAAASGALMLDQFCNEHNARAHYVWTGAEILNDVPQVDIFIAGLGTGGTVMGCGRRLKEANPSTKVIAVEPHPGSAVQGLQSLADGFIPPILDLGFLDGKILVRSGAAMRAARAVMTQEAIFAGVSSGAVLHAGLRFAERLERGNIVMMFADSGWKYLGTNLWSRPEPPSEAEDDDQDDIIWW